MMINLKYTVIYPAVNHDNPDNDPYIKSVSKQRSFAHVVTLHDDSISRIQVCDVIFAGMNGGSGSEFPWFLNSRARSMSVGDVIRFENSNLYYICDSCGWMVVNKEIADSWLNFPRKYGCCSFELHQWQVANNINS